MVYYSRISEVELLLRVHGTHGPHVLLLQDVLPISLAGVTGSGAFITIGF